SITSLSAFFSSMSAPKTASSKSKACGGNLPNPLPKLWRLARFLVKLVLPPPLFEYTFSKAIPKNSSDLVSVWIVTNNKNIKNKQEQSIYLYTLRSMLKKLHYNSLADTGFHTNVFHTSC